MTASKTVARMKPGREFKSPSRRLQDPADQAGIGGVAERPNAAALKTAVRGNSGQGFESLSRRTHGVHSAVPATERQTVGLSFRKTIKLGKKTRLNVSRSGITASRKAGPVTVNSRGRVTIRLGKGFTWRL